MARGSRALYGTDIAVSTTGYAGPGEGERGEPAGLVYIGVDGSWGTEIHKEQFRGGRKACATARRKSAVLCGSVSEKHIKTEKREI